MNVFALRAWEWSKIAMSEIGGLKSNKEKSVPQKAHSCYFKSLYKISII